MTEALQESLAPKKGWMLLLELGGEILNWQKQQMFSTQREVNFLNFNFYMIKQNLFYLIAVIVFLKIFI